MKKTITIQLQGQVFHIENDAYEKLQNYLLSLEEMFNNTDGGVEIMDDVKTRLVELFQNDNNLITMEMVDSAIETMGGLEDFGETKPNTRIIKRKLYRDIDNKIIGGVCSGLARYFGIDPVLIRILFVIFFFVSGISLLVYPILWIVMKAAKTTSQKLEMDGELPTISSIKNYFYSK